MPLATLDATPGPPIQREEAINHLTERAGLREYALLAILLAAAFCSAGLLVWQTLSPQAAVFGGMIIDRLSTLLTLLVAAVGAVTFRFSLVYLDGEPGQVRFLRWLFWTICAAYLLMLSTNLWLLFCAWLVVSVGLHQLLLFYQDRPAALRPARKKFFISRLGDGALLSAICLIGGHWKTWDLRDFLAASAHDTGGIVTLVGVLVVIAALTKSAQFPFHSWLPETMEAPTPVSALMHAGIINAGGALVLRFAPLISRTPSALFLLALIGTITVVLGMLAMWAQPNVKRTLAWSTVSQMGFMMAECGIGAFSAAALHIIGHGFYKAWSFLHTGDVPKYTAASAAPISPAAALLVSALGTGAGLLFVMGTARLTRFYPLHSPGEFALSLILSLSLGQFWAACVRTAPQARRRTVLAGVVLVSASASLAACTLYEGANAFFAPVFGPLPNGAGPMAWVTASLPVIALAALCVLHPLLPALMQTKRGRAFHVHALHGFYVGALADQIVDRFLPKTDQRRTDYA